MDSVPSLGSHPLSGEAASNTQHSQGCRVWLLRLRSNAVLEGHRKLRIIIPFMRAPSSGPNGLPKAPPTNTSTLGFWFQYVNFGDTQSMAMME